MHIGSLLLDVTRLYTRWVALPVPCPSLPRCQLTVVSARAPPLQSQALPQACARGSHTDAPALPQSGGCLAGGVAHQSRPREGDSPGDLLRKREKMLVEQVVWEAGWRREGPGLLRVALGRSSTLGCGVQVGPRGSSVESPGLGPGVMATGSLPGPSWDRRPSDVRTTSMKSVQEASLEAASGREGGAIFE